MASILVSNPAVELTQRVPFTYTSGTLILQAVPAGSLIDGASISIQHAFDDPAATIILGTTTVPGLVFSLGDVTPSVAGQYQNPGVEVVTVNDFLRLVIHPAASTQGNGLLVYKFRS